MRKMLILVIVALVVVLLGIQVGDIPWPESKHCSDLSYSLSTVLLTGKDTSNSRYSRSNRQTWIALHSV